MKAQGRLGVGQEVDPLAALDIGVEHEAAVIDALEQNDARRGNAPLAHRRQGHGIGQVGLAFARFLIPKIKQIQGVRMLHVHHLSLPEFDPRSIAKKEFFYTLDGIMVITGVRHMRAEHPFARRRFSRTHC